MMTDDFQKFIKIKMYMYSNSLYACAAPIMLFHRPLKYM